MGFDGDLVGHGAGGAEQARFQTEQGGGFLFQGQHAGVFGENIVANGGLHHGLQHGRSGPGKRIAAQIN
jgi:hypothetical protein